MAQIPTPRSYSEILGDMIDAFLSRYGLPALKIGSPVLSILEAAAQSQLRSSEDIFTLLEAESLDQATGIALDRIGADESVTRNTENPSSGSVNISDTSFTKLSSKVFQGTPAPIAGSVNINVTDASQFPASGSIYLGRGTSNYEGPLAFTSKTNNGNYWTLVLSTGTLKFHNIGESVIVAQGGNRTINPGTIVQSAQGANASSTITFKVLYKATVPDGENLITGVTVLAVKPGITGNVIAGAISSFGTSPFNGAAVTNPLPFTNGLAAETDDAYRERIRQARQSRTRGTPLAIQTFAVGVISTDENKRVISSSLVSRTGGGMTLYIDDGTGYEEVSTGVAIESFIDLAVGGERYFKISSPRPVTKAYVLSSQVAPFTLKSGLQLGFTVGGVTTVHTFADDGTFRAIGNATAFEVVASINADSALNWSARTYAGGTQVAVFSKADTNESIQNVANTNDANAFLGFGSGRSDTMRLYKNDRLLNKDGALAIITSNGVALWATMTSSETLVLASDGTPAVTYTFTDQDFINAGYVPSTSRAVPAAWAAIFNARIPGITASVVNGLITLTSNRSLSAAAQIVISSGTLVTKQMFAAQTSTGSNSDYTLDRNTGEFRLTNVLAAGDRLAAGSVNTRSFLQTPALGSITVPGSGAHQYYAVDGNATIIASGLTSSTSVNWTSTAETWGVRLRFTSSAASALFSNVLVGDWVVFWDPSSPGALLNTYWRVAAVDSGGTWVEFDKATDPAIGANFFFPNGGVSFIRTPVQLQPFTLAAGAYSAASIAAAMDLVLLGAQATVYRTTAMRINTSSFGLTVGSIALVAQDANGALIGLTPANYTANLTGHLASVESGNSELGTPGFHETVITSASGAGNPTVYWSPDAWFTNPDLADSFVGLHPNPDGVTTALTRYGNNWGYSTTMSALTINGGNSYSLTLRANPFEWHKNSRAYFASPFRFASNDQLTVLVDQDTNSKRFTIPMWRTLSTVSSTYAGTNTFKDADNGNQSLAIGFGSGSSGFTFNDFAVYMRARNATHALGAFSSYVGGAIADTTRTVLWRYYRYGAEGNWAKVAYTLPAAPNLPVAVTVNTYSDQFTYCSIALASGAQRTGYTLTAGDSMAVASLTPTAGLALAYYILQYPIATAVITGTNSAVLTLTMPSGLIDHGLQNATSYYVTITGAAGGITSGLYAVSARTTTTVTITGAAWTNGTYNNIGQISVGQGQPTFAGGSIAVGDFVHVGPANSIIVGAAAMYHGITFRNTSVIATTPFWLSGIVEASGGSATATIFPVGDPTQLTIYVNPQQTASTIVAAVNALAAQTNSTVPITGTAIGTGAGLIERSSEEDLLTNQYWTQLLDGINYVQTTTIPGSSSGDYQLTFKNAISAALATNSDWQHELIKIMPRTAVNTAAWFNAPTVSGLFSVADIERSSSAHKIQFASLTPGSTGSIQVQGGGANAGSAPIQGAATSLGNGALVATVNASDLTGFVANGWVAINNTYPLPKAGVFGATSTLAATTLISTNTYRLQFTNVATYSTTATSSSSSLMLFEKQGAFIAIHDTGKGGTFHTTGVNEGDYIRIAAPATPTYYNVPGNSAQVVNTGNVGIFRVVRVINQPDFFTNGGMVWIENTAAVEQLLAECDVQFLSNTSILPGDKLSISTTIFDQFTAGLDTGSNKGVYTVVDVGNAGAGSYANSAYVTITGPFNLLSSGSAALGSASAQVQIIEGTPTRLIKQILSIQPNQTLGSQADIKFTTNLLSGRVSATAGSILSALDKLNFSTTLSQGIDGYQHSTGLIAEVNKVIYGDPSDTATYPGVAAAGASINIQGPLVKRIQVTLSIRIRTGAAQQDIQDRVKSTVASVINQTPVGTSIALSDLTKAASKVGGVISAVMVSPLATAGTDLITVQPYEKPLVLNVDTDILISFAGN